MTTKRRRQTPAAASSSTCPAHDPREATSCAYCDGYGGSIDWWLAEVAREPLAPDAECLVRGDVLDELLKSYAERAS